jgi:D-alanyl-lipoteichoic acid acyltransferase DltB (MBOAT superfamily)
VAVLWHGIASGFIVFGLFALLLYWTAIYERNRSGSYEAVRMLLTLGPLSIYIPVALLPEFLF